MCLCVWLVSVGGEDSAHVGGYEWSRGSDEGAAAMQKGADPTVQDQVNEGVSKCCFSCADVYVCVYVCGW